MTLLRLVRNGTLRKPARGLYYYPKTDPAIGELAPSLDAIAKALSGRDRLRLQPSGAYAANLLRLSEQVPMKVVFLTDGVTRKIRVGRQEITLKRTTPRNMAAAGRASGLVIQALRHLGQPNVTLERIRPLHGLLSERDRKQLARDLRLAPAWMHPFLRVIAGEEKRP